MSNQTGWKAKISYISGKLGLTKHEPKGKKKAAITDTYKHNKTNAYKKIVEGRQHPVRYDMIQSILGGMTPNMNVDMDDFIIDVPHIKDVSKANPFQFNDMEPVVERYAGVEKMLLAQMAEVKKMLNPKNMSRLSAPEVANLRGRLDKIGDRLGFCKQQLQQSQLRLEWQRQNELHAWKESQADLIGTEDEIGIEN